MVNFLLNSNFKTQWNISTSYSALSACLLDARMDRQVKRSTLYNQNVFIYSFETLSLEHLIMAGIIEAEYLIIVKKERSFSNEELALEDCNTILTVQYIFR